MGYITSARSHPFEVLVYGSVQGAPLGQTVPISVQAVRSFEVLISNPTAVALEELRQ